MGPGGDDEPEEVGEDMGVFGYTKMGVENVGHASDLVGTIFPYPSGAPVNSFYAPGTWPTWPTPADFTIDETLPCYSIHCITDEEDRARSIVAYVEYPEGDGPATDTMKAAIYKPDGTFVAATEPQVLTEGDPAAWATFTFAEPPTLVPETNYVLLVWAQNPAGMDSSLWGDHLEDYVPPAVIAAEDTIVLEDAVAFGGIGVGIRAEDTIVFGERLRHGGVLAPCSGRYIKPDPEDHGANPHRGRG